MKRNYSTVLSNGKCKSRQSLAEIKCLKDKNRQSKSIKLLNLFSTSYGDKLANINFKINPQKKQKNQNNSNCKITKNNNKNIFHQKLSQDQDNITKSRNFNFDIDIRKISQSSNHQNQNQNMINSSSNSNVFAGHLKKLSTSISNQLQEKLNQNIKEVVKQFYKNVYIFKKILCDVKRKKQIIQKIYGWTKDFQKILFYQVKANGKIRANGKFNDNGKGKKIQFQKSNRFILPSKKSKLQNQNQNRELIMNKVKILNLQTFNQTKTKQTINHAIYKSHATQGVQVSLCEVYQDYQDYQVYQDLTPFTDLQKIIYNIDSNKDNLGIDKKYFCQRLRLFNSQLIEFNEKQHHLQTQQRKNRLRQRIQKINTELEKFKNSSIKQKQDYYQSVKISQRNLGILKQKIKNKGQNIRKIRQQTGALNICQFQIEVQSKLNLLQDVLSKN